MNAASQNTTTESAEPQNQESQQGDGKRQRMREMQEKAARHTELALEYMEQYGVKPEGKVRPFLPPSERQQEIDRLPYEHDATQRVTYETEPGEFSALCPFSGLPDYGTVRIEYAPGDWIVELKSLKYYLMSWREVGAAQEDLTPVIYQDLMRHLVNPQFLVVTTEYNVRGGINTTCVIDSREQEG